VERHQKLQDLKNDNRALKDKLIKQKQLNEALIESQNIQQTILERSLVGYYISLNGKFCVMNQIAVSYTGYHAEDLIGRESDFLIHPEDKDHVKTHARAMIMGKNTSPYEYRIITKQQDVRWVLEAVVPIMFEGKRAILGNAMDITQRKMAEKKLIESENLYRTIFETTGTMTFIIENDKTLSLINSEFEKLTGFCKGDWEGKRKWSEFVDQQDLPRMEEYHHLRGINPSAVPTTYEYHLIDSQGRIRNVLTTINIIPGTNKKVSSVTDVTELKEAEKELLLKTQNLSDLNSALKVLLKQREEDREEFETTLLSNVKELVLPYIEKIRHSGMDKRYSVYVDLLESNLENILSPFSRMLSAKYMHLTPKEIQVANFIKDGKCSKDIAGILNVSSSAVDVYRYRIRNKLGLNNKKVNLMSYLTSQI
jgi:PAS domain S-box-containing protein